MNSGAPAGMVDVVIIGCGPVGATLANLLGQYGLSVRVFEREADIYALPRAIHFDGEVMRVFETAGLREPIERISRPGLKGMHFNNAAGDTLMIRAGTAARGPHGCANNHYFHQPELEAVLRAGLQRFADVQLFTGHEVMAIDEGEAAVALQVRDLATQHTGTVQARWVVGCDGARSLVRKVLGSPMEDLGLHQPWLVFDARLKADVPGLPEYTVQHCDPARPMTYCNVTGNRRRWEIMLMPGDDPQQLVQPATLWNLVQHWITPDQADIERAVIYTFHSVIAQGWRRGRLILAGDAAHQTPPFLGQGMCAGIRDAANLAWKMDAIVRGGADASLLDTYESERSSHVRAFIELAVRLGAIIQTTDPQAARERDARFKAGQPEIFQFPVPQLGAGVWCGDHPAVGRVFPQPLLDSGLLLDALVGQRFSLIAEPALLEATAHASHASARAICAALGVALLPAHDAELRAWLAQQQVAAVMLRPDRYVMGVARSAQELLQLTDMARQAALAAGAARRADSGTPLAAVH